MQIVIDIPDTISLARIEQIVEKIERQLKNESELIKIEKRTTRKIYAHRFSVESINLPSREALHER